jgi:hypothetical protein
VPTSFPWDVVLDVGFKDLTMKKWIDFLSRLGGGTKFQFDAKFFQWWDCHIVVVDDYAYHSLIIVMIWIWFSPRGKVSTMSLVRKINLQYFFIFLMFL